MTWRIIQSRKIDNDIDELCRRAEIEGRLDEVLRALKHVRQKLAANALAVGEPHNFLKHLELLLCVVVEAPLVVRFAVDEKRNWVYLRSVELLNGH